jgi:hypothetical protein
MSAPTVDAQSEPSGAALIGIAAALMSLAGIAAFLLLGTGGPTDGRAKMMQVFGVADLPFGMRIESATSMSSSGTLVVYSVPGAPAESAPAEPVAAPAQPEPTPDGGAASPKPVDWTKIEIPAESGPPRQVAFLFVPSGNGRSVLDTMIRDVYGRDRGLLGPEGGTVLVERGRLDFHGWDSDWIHMRTYESGGTFRDAMRISLSTPEEPCVVTATWPRGVPASQAVLEEIVRPIVTAPPVTRPAPGSSPH